jgi:hypothetical protein
MVKDVHIVLSMLKSTSKFTEEDGMCKKQLIFWKLQTQQYTHEEEAPAESQSETTYCQQKPWSQMKWSPDVMNVGQVNDEGVPFNTEVNMRISRVCGLADQQRVSLAL